MPQKRIVFNQDFSSRILVIVSFLRVLSTYPANLFAFFFACIGLFANFADRIIR